MPDEVLVTRIDIPQEGKRDGILLGIDNLGAYYSEKELGDIAGGDANLGASIVLYAMSTTDSRPGDERPLISPVSSLKSDK